MNHPQSGITNRPSEHLILAALTFVDRSPAGSHAALESLRGVVQRELRSDLDDPNSPTEKDVPSAETGELGFEDRYDRGHLTITLGLASTAFDALGVSAGERPHDLEPIPWDKLGDTPASADSGDLILQICSDDPYVAEHVVRRVEEELGAQLTVTWTHLGTQRYTSRSGRVSRHEGRALIGFLDGTSNLDPRNTEADRALVFVDPGAVRGYPQLPAGQQPGYPGSGPNFPGDLRPPPTAEPDWTRQGSYMVVRVSTFPTATWDKQTQNAQEQSVGRFKVSGASLDRDDDEADTALDPAFAADQSNTTVPFDAHIRKANPRRDGDSDRRIFRRGYPLIASSDGGLQRGLAFICFARTISTQFEFIYRAWIKNPDFPQPGAGTDRLLFTTLTEQIMAGGYYFAPPIQHSTEPWSWIIPPSAN